MGAEIDPSLVETLLYDPFAFSDEYLLGFSSSDEEEEHLGGPNVDHLSMTDRAFRDAFHVDKSVYTKLVELLDDGLGYCGCVATRPDEAAALVLRYLSHVEGYGEIGRAYGMSATCASNVVRKGVRTLSASADKYIEWPSLERQCEAARSFYDVSRIDGAVGSIEVTRFEVDMEDDESKGTGITVQGVVSFDCRFVDVFVGEGSDDPSALLEKSCVVEHDALGEYFLVGNRQCYGRRGSIVTPFPDVERTTWRHERFNKNLEIVYTRSLKAFGYLKGRFPRLARRLEGDARFAADLVRAGCVLHNLCADAADCEYFVKDGGVPGSRDDHRSAGPIGRERRARAFEGFVRACAS